MHFEHIIQSYRNMFFFMGWGVCFKDEFCHVPLKYKCLIKKSDRIYVHMYLLWALPMSTNNLDNPFDLGKYPHELAIVNCVDRHSKF